MYYADPKTGAQHLWGVGHLSMRVGPPAEGKKAVVHGFTVCGLAAGIADGTPFVSVGWERQQTVDILDSNTAVRLEYPTSDLMTIRVGGAPPRVPEEPKEVP